MAIRTPSPPPRTASPGPSRSSAAASSRSGTRSSGGLADAFARAADLIERAGGSVVVTGMGKSGHVGKKVAATLASTGTPSHYVHPAEASHGDLGALRDTDVVLAMSWSGETPELADIVDYTRRFGMPLVAVTARPDSALGRAADVGLFLPDAQEACPNGLAPTTSTTMQLAVGDALAILLLERRGFTATDFNRYHPGGKLGARLMAVGRLMHVGEEMPIITAGCRAVGGDRGDDLQALRHRRRGRCSEGDLIGVLTDGDVRRAFQRWLPGPADRGGDGAPPADRGRRRPGRPGAGADERRADHLHVRGGGTPAGRPGPRARPAEGADRLDRTRSSM